MVAFRTDAQVSRNIVASEGRSRQQSALNASLAARKAEADAAAITRTSIGLGSVDNTSDVNKPVSSATQTALNLRADASALAAKLQWASVPATAGAAGTAGQIAYDATHIYVAVATNTWVRALLATW